MNNLYRFFVVAFCLAVIALVPACSSSPKLVKVKGTLSYKGQPYIPTHNGSVGIKFIPIVEAEAHHDTYVADFNRETGEFVVNGKTGAGIPAGKYRIAINQRIIDMPADIAEMNDRFSQQNTQIVREVNDETPVLIDLAKPEGE